MFSRFKGPEVLQGTYRQQRRVMLVGILMATVLGRKAFWPKLGFRESLHTSQVQ